MTAKQRNAVGTFGMGDKKMKGFFGGRGGIRWRCQMCPSRLCQMFP